MSNELHTAILQAIDGQRRDGKMDSVTAAALSTYQPTTLQMLTGGLGWEQGDPIGDFLLPPYPVSSSMRAGYTVYGKEGFLVMRDAAGVGLADVIGINGEFLRSDISQTRVYVDLEMHGWSEWLDQIERKEAAAIGQNLEDEKAADCKSKVDTGREAEAARLITTTSSYLSSSYYETLSGTGQWSHGSSTPLSAIVAKIEFLSGAVPGIRKKLALWLSPTAFSKLRFHASVIALVSGGATRANPSMPVGVELISAILGIPVFVGDAVQTTAPGGATTDIWNDGAGLIAISPPNVKAVRFGSTLVMPSEFPSQRVATDEHKGAKTIDILYYTDAYKHVVQLNTAGYLWLDVTA